MISYEIAMGLSLVSVFLYAGSMSTSQIVAAQADANHVHLLGHSLALPSWFAIQLLPAFLIYMIAMVGETNRPPFDLPEAEGELVGGFHTEYSSLKFAMFFLAEYVNMITVSAIATTLFLGGWRAPFPLSAIGHGVLNTGWWPVLWFVGKLFGFLFFFIWLRGTLPRLRYDQFMRFGWKLLIPAGLVWIVAVSALRELRSGRLTGSSRTAVVVLLLVLFALVYLAAEQALRRRDASREAMHLQVPDEVDPFAGGFPVPPLPGQRLIRTSGPVAVAQPAVVAASAGSGGAWALSAGADEAAGAGADQDDADSETTGEDERG